MHKVPNVMYIMLSILAVSKISANLYLSCVLRIIIRLFFVVY